MIHGKFLMFLTLTLILINGCSRQPMPNLQEIKTSAENKAKDIEEAKIKMELAKKYITAAPMNKDLINTIVAANNNFKNEYETTAEFKTRVENKKSSLDGKVIILSIDNKFYEGLLFIPASNRSPKIMEHRTSWYDADTKTVYAGLNLYDDLQFGYYDDSRSKRWLIPIKMSYDGDYVAGKAIYRDTGYYLNLTKFVDKLREENTQISRDRVQPSIMGMKGTILTKLIQNISPEEARFLMGNNGNNISIKIICATTKDSNITKSSKINIIDGLKDIMIVFYNNKTNDILKVFY